MIAYKFLAAGALGPFSGFAWRVPASGASGDWVEVEGPLRVCARGVHVCRTFELAHWLHEELWEVETDGDEMEGLDCIIVQRARLLRRIETWSDGGARRFAAACIEHASTLAGPEPSDIVRAFVEDARRAASGGYVALSAFCAALAIAKLGDASENVPSYRQERIWQAAWIARHLIGG